MSKKAKTTAIQPNHLTLVRRSTEVVAFPGALEGHQIRPPREGQKWPG